jgi:rubrerythrin
MKAEIGDNLKELFIKIIEQSGNIEPEQIIKAIMEQFTEMIENQQTYICPMCGTANFIGEYCVRCKEK